MTGLIALLCTVQAASPIDIAAWRARDSGGSACASCHSPDGIELSVYRYDEKDILRRASAHFSAEKQMKVLQVILSGRTGLKTVDPMKERPLQPGGRVLAGKTAADRDNAFLKGLARVTPRLAGAPVKTLADAQAVCKEVLAVDLPKMPVGFVLNRLSEDGFHGKEHASLANWIPDLAMPLTPSVLAAQDAYLAKPCNSTLLKVDEAVRDSFSPRTPIQYLSLAKYRSLLQLQHRLRVEAGRAPRETLDTPFENPFWQVAELGRQFSEAQMTLPTLIAEAKTKGPTLTEQMRVIRLPWFWLGWTADPGLQNSGGLPETRRADYFTQALLEDGPYSSHALWMLTRKLLEQSRPGPRAKPWEIQYSFLLLGDSFTTREPSDPAMRKLFRRVAGNAFRTCIWLLCDDMERTKETVVPESQTLQLRLMGEYLESIGEPEKALVERANKLLATTHARGRPPIGRA